jgi:hypothetical protein
MAGKWKEWELGGKSASWSLGGMDAPVKHQFCTAYPPKRSPFALTAHGLLAASSPKYLN